MKRFWIFILIAGMAILAVSAFQFLMAPGKGDVAPAFELESTDGRTVSLLRFKGRPVIVHFWASFCGNCIHELPSIERIYNDMKDEGLGVISIAEDDLRDLDKVKGISQKTGISFDVLMDQGGRVADAYASFAVPETFFIDQNGMIVFRRAGEIDWDSAEVRSMIRRQIDKR